MIPQHIKLRTESNLNYVQEYIGGLEACLWLGLSQSHFLKSKRKNDLDVKSIHCKQQIYFLPDPVFTFWTHCKSLCITKETELTKIYMWINNTGVSLLYAKKSCW